MVHLRYFVLFADRERDLKTVESTQESDSSANNSIFNFGLNVVYSVLVVTAGGVICIVCLLLFCASIFHTWKNREQELELRRIQSEQSAQRNANNKKEKMKNRNIQLAPIPTIANMMANNNNNPKLKNDDMQSEKKNSKNNLILIKNVNRDDEGKIDTDRFTDSDESDEGIQIKYKHESVASDNHDTLAATNYKTWNQEQVLSWIKTNLINNGLGNEQIDKFLNEFRTKSITGKMLSQFEQQLNADSEKRWNQFRGEFSKENQTFGIWFAIETAVKAIEIDVNTKGEEQ